MAKNIYTDRQYEETFGAGEMIPRPIVAKIEVTGLSYDTEGQVTLMMGDGELKEDLNLPVESHLTEMVNKIKMIINTATKECLVTFQRWGD